MLFNQKPRSHLARLVNSSWLFLILGFACMLITLGQLERVWYEILIFAFFLSLMFAWPIVANYHRFAIYILDVHAVGSQITIRFLDSDFEKSITVEKQRLTIAESWRPKAGLLRGEDHQIKMYEEAEPVLIFYDYQSFTGVFYTEQLIKNMEEVGVRKI